MLRNAIDNEFDTMFEEENVIGCLNELDNRIDQTRPDQRTWRPSGDARLDIKATNISIKIKQKAKLEKMLQEAKQAKNKVTVKVKNETISLTKLTGKLQEQMQHVEESYQDCTTEIVEHLSPEEI